MNIDENLQKIISTLLKKWKLLLIFAVIGTISAFVYTANFTTLTYSSSVEFLAYVDDSNQELSDSTSAAQSQSTASYQASQTSKMNYAMKMLDTYIEIFTTNEFNQTVADEVNRSQATSISANDVRRAISIEAVENTAMFICNVTTTDADLSYNIAKALESCIPESMENTNQGLVRASVEDKPLKASPGSLGYPKKCLIGAAAGVFLAAVYVILRDLLDVRIKTAEDLEEKYDIPVLGSIPEFEARSSNSKHSAKENKADVSVKGAE